MNDRREPTLRESVEKVRSIDVHQMIVEDIVKPGVKSAVSDLLANVIDTCCECGKDIISTLLGFDVEPSSTYTDYRSRSKKHRTVKRRTDVDSITIPTKAECYEILDELKFLIKRRGEATVADYYNCFPGHPSDFTDERYGWKHISDVRIRKKSNGYVLMLPPAEEL